MAGRCVSATHIALGTVRVQNTLATIGQAAGTAAALAIDKGVTPRVLGQEHITELQQLLLRNDHYIPGLRNTDGHDLARKAKITATSQSPVEKYNPHRGIEGPEQQLDEVYCVLFRQKPTGDAKRELELYVKNKGPATRLEAEWVGLESLDIHDVAEKISTEVPADFEGFVSIKRSAELPGRMGGIRLLPNPQLYVKRVELADHGYSLLVRRPPYWTPSRFTTLEHRFTDDPVPLVANTAPENVSNGVGRAVSPEDYAWVSDPAQPLPQDITLDFGTPTKLSRVQIVFDTDLCNPKMSYELLPVPTQLVKDYDILLDGGVALSVRDSNARFRRHELNATASSLTVRVLATYGDPSARIFEVRVY
jgi:hypothetical protein